MLLRGLSATRNHRDGNGLGSQIPSVQKYEGFNAIMNIMIIMNRAGQHFPYNILQKNAVFSVREAIYNLGLDSINSFNFRKGAGMEFWKSQNTLFSLAFHLEAIF